MNNQTKNRLKKTLQQLEGDHEMLKHEVTGKPKLFCEFTILRFKDNPINIKAFLGAVLPTIQLDSTKEAELFHEMIDTIKEDKYEVFRENDETRGKLLSYCASQYNEANKRKKSTPDSKKLTYMNQGIIDDQIKFRIEENPTLENIFSDKKISRLINSLRAIEYKTPPETLMDFIDGIALIPDNIKHQDPEISNKISILTDPATEYLKDHIRSDSYQKSLIDKEISGDEELIINDIKIPLSKKAIELHIKRKKAIPLVPKDIAAIQADLVSSKQNQYNPSGKSQNKDLDTILASQNHLIPKVPIKEVYDHFKPLTEKTNQRDKFYLTNQQLLTFIKSTFIDQKPIKQSLNCAPIFNKIDVREVFYKFYFKSQGRETNQKKLKRKYFNILFNSFEGFHSKTDYNDFHKTKKRKT